MLFRENHRDPLVAMATVVELEEGMDSLLNHLNKVLALRNKKYPRLRTPDLYFKRIDGKPLIDSFEEEWSISIMGSQEVIGFTDREPRVIAPQERFKSILEKESTLKNHFEVVWEHYSRIAIWSVPVDANTLVMKAIDPDTHMDGTPGNITRLRGSDFRALLLSTRLGLIVYIFAIEHILNVDTKHGMIAASDAIDALTPLTGPVGEDDLENKLSHIFGTGIIGDDFSTLNWGERLEKVSSKTR